MANPRTGFGPEAQTIITELLRFADMWSALKVEFDTFAHNGITMTDAYVQTFLPNLTAATFTDTLVAMQEAVDYIHNTVGNPSRVDRLYRGKR